ncbi:MAG: serine/threonine-protein kinase [Kofleriaceae bacterium]
MIGEVVGSYRIVAEIGRGGMGMVYRADHVQLGRAVALKMLLPQLSADPAIVQRFFNEARAASAIVHPGIVEVFDFGHHHDGRAFIVMALLPGTSLDHRLLHGALPPLEAATLVAQVASALTAAHAAGIIHRDLKPDNIFLVPNELLPFGTQVKLLDFGIAKLADDKQPGFKTQTGALIGTPAYMSPEQCMGRSDIDLRTDLYSLGCILFHLLTGRPPFLSDHGTGVMIAAHMRDPAPHPRTFVPDVPEPLAAITMRLLEKAPAARFQSAAELRTALVAAGATSTVTRPPVVDELGATLVGVTSVPPAATTHGRSAAQVLPSLAPRKSARGLWLGLAIVVVAGGGIAAAALATRGGGGDDHQAAVQPIPPPPPTPPAQLAECADEQMRNDDTKGHCCWREQAWSTAKNRCVGTPSCPVGFEVKAETCVALAGAAPRPPIAPVQQAMQTVAPKLALDAKVYAPGGAITIRFASPISSQGAHRAWVTIAPEGSAPTTYGAWSYVADGATTVTSLEAPARSGGYEVRLHTEYPTKSFNVAQTARFTVGTGQAPALAVTMLAAQRFTISNATVKIAEPIAVRFAVPLQALPKEQFWITIVEKGAPDTKWGAYQYVKAGAHGLQLPAPTTPGDYEIRLHANYPTKTTNLVHRVAIRVD